MSGLEILDVVDADDQVIGARVRSEIHALQLRHRAVHILVFNLEHHVFLQQRSWQKDVAPGLWDTSAAGHLDQGESYDNAASRELGEELAITEVRLNRLFKLAACAATGWEFVWVYQCTTSQQPVPNPEEIAGGMWINPDDLGRALAATPEQFTITLQLLWQRLGARRGGG